MEPSFTTVTPTGWHQSVRARLLAFFVGATLALAALALLVTGGFRGGDELARSTLAGVSGGAVNTYTYEHQETPLHTYSTTGRIALTSGDAHYFSIRTEGKEYVLEQDGKEITRSTIKLDAPSMSPNGDIIAYSGHPDMYDIEDAKAGRKNPEGLVLARPSDWHVETYEPKTKKTTRIAAAGYGPVFLNNSEFVYFGPDGLNRYDLTKGTAVRIIERKFSVTVGPVVLSPDHSLVAFRDLAAQTTLVYRLSPMGASLVVEVPELLASVGLSNTALYNMKRTDAGSELWHYGFKGGVAEKVRVFPKELNLVQIIF